MNFLKRDDASITIEAALVLPFFALFIIFLTCMIKLAIYEVAVDHATAEATKQVATHVYPVVLVKDAAQQRISLTPAGQQFETYKNKGENIRDFVESNIQLISGFISPTIEETYKMSLDKVKEILSSPNELEGGSAEIFSPLVRHYLDVNISNEEDLKVTKATIPSLFNKNEAYFGLEVTYKVDLPIPFMKKQVEIKKSAYERIWVGE